MRSSACADHLQSTTHSAPLPLAAEPQENTDDTRTMKMLALLALAALATATVARRVPAKKSAEAVPYDDAVEVNDAAVGGQHFSLTTYPRADASLDQSGSRAARRQRSRREARMMWGAQMLSGSSHFPLLPTIIRADASGVVEAISRS